jgi:hypothetical protein
VVRVDVVFVTFDQLPVTVVVVTVVLEKLVVLVVFDQLAATMEEVEDVVVVVEEALVSLETLIEEDHVVELVVDDVHVMFIDRFVELPIVVVDRFAMCGRLANRRGWSNSNSS